MEQQKIENIKDKSSSTSRLNKLLEQGGDHFRLFYHNSPLGYQSLNEDGRIIEINPAWLELLGYSRKEVIGKRFDDFLTEEYKVSFPENFSRFKTIGSIYGKRFTLKRKNGDLVDVEIDGKVGYDIHGKFKQTYCVLRDITEKNQNEKQLKTIKFAIDKSSVAAFWIDKKARFIYVNEEACKSLGYSKEELLNLTVFDVDPNILKEDWAEHWQRDKDKGYLTFESIHRTKSGELFPIEVSVNHFEYDGEEYHFVFAQDITERKVAEKALEESEERFRILFELAPDAIYLNDYENRFIDGNKASEKLTGYLREELAGKHVSETGLLSEEGLAKSYEALKKNAAEGPCVQVEYEVNRKDNTKVIIEERTFQVNIGGQPLMLNIARDITERKKAEEALRRTSDNLAKAQEIANVGSWEWDIVNNKLYCSEQIYRIYGIDVAEEEPSIDKALNMVHPGDKEILGKAIESVVNGISPGYLEFRIIRSDGQIRYVHSKVELVYNENGDFTGAIGALQDVTELKVAQKALEESEERFKIVFELAPDVIYLNDYEGRFIDGNKASEELTGYAKEELIGKHVSETGLLSEEGLLKAYEAIRRNAAGEPCISEEYVINRKDNTKVIAEVRNFPVNIGGQPMMLNIARDITERKKAEEDLRKISDNLAQAQEIANIGSWEWDTLNNELYCSDQIYRIYSIEKKERPSIEQALEMVHPDDKELLGKSIEKTYIGKAPDFIEFRIIRSDGQVRYLQSRSKMIHNEKGQTIRLVGSLQDVTELKLAEKALNKSENMLRTIINSTQEAMISLDEEGKITLLNPAAEKMFGWSKADVMNQPIEILVPEEYRRKHREHVRKYFAASETDISKKKIKEYFGRRSDGTVFPMSMSMSRCLIDGKKFVILVARDITENKEAEKALRESEERYRTLVENQTDMVVKFNNEGRLTFISPSYCKTFGRKQEELLGTKLLPFIHENDRTRVAVALEKVYFEPYSTYVEHRTQTKEGLRWHGWINSAIFDDNKEIIGIVATGRDITKRKQAEEALRSSEERFKSFFENTSVGIYRTTPDGRILMSNPALVKMLGYESFEELSKRNLEEEGFQPNYPRSAFKEKIERDGQVIGLESIWIKHDGTTIFIHENATKIEDSEGNVYYEGTVEDITEHKTAEEKFSRKHNQLLALMNAIPDPIFIKDTKGRFIGGNEAFVHSMGFKYLGDILGKTDFDVLEYDEAKRYLTFDQELFESGQPLIGRITFTTDKNGAHKWYMISKIPLRDSKGEIIGLVGIYRDVTELIESQNEHKKLMEVLEEKNWELENIIRVASHDLRTPLITISGFSKELEKSLTSLNSLLTSADQTQDIKTIDSFLQTDIIPPLELITASASKMDSLLDGLLRIARLGYSAEEMEEIEVNTLIDEILHTFAFQIKQSNINVKVDDDLPCCFGDKSQLSLVFSNLISNAIKYLNPGREGEIKIQGKKKRKSTEYCIEDNGIGISKKNLTSIFQMYYRINPNKGSGEGLGLAIVRRIINRHNGKVWVKSEEGEGSKFFVSLPNQ